MSRFTTIRPLPALITAAVLLLGFKLVDIWQDAGTVFGVAPAVAGAAPAKTAGKPPAGTASERPDEQQSATADDAADLPPPKDPSLMTPAELDILQDLAMRRQELEKQAREQEMRENLLRAAEQRIDKKIAELKQLEASVKGLLKAYDEEEEKQFRSLVKVYENMKPKAAAPIFEKLDDEVLIAVATRMKEAKLAPILSKMGTERARFLTVELANRPPLPARGEKGK